MLDAESGLFTYLSTRRLLDLNAMNVFSDDEHSVLWRPRSNSGALEQLAESLSTDKGASLDYLKSGAKVHSYLSVYELFLGDRRNFVSTVLEVGIGYPNGANGRMRAGDSLRMWEQYFPNAKIYGADINRDAFISTDSIACHYVDQTSSASVQQLLDSIGSPCDVIIDDGLHTFNANRVLFETAFPKMAPKGLYFIEDCQLETRNLFVQYLDDLQLSFHVFSGLRPNRYRTGDDTLIVVQK